MDNRLVSGDRCPALKCNLRPEPGRILCSWHRAFLPAAAHRAYLGLLDLFTAPLTPANLVRAAAILAETLAVVALKEGHIGPAQARRVSERYAGLAFLTGRQAAAGKGKR